MAKVLSSAALDVARENDVQSLRDMIDFDAGVVHAQGLIGDTLLIKAAACNSYDVARVLLEHGADANATNSHGKTPLIEAAASGHEAMLVLLLSYGAKVTVKDDLGLDALTAAAIGGFDRCVDILVPHLPAKAVDEHLSGTPH